MKKKKKKKYNCCSDDLLPPYNAECCDGSIGTSAPFYYNSLGSRIVKLSYPQSHEAYQIYSLLSYFEELIFVNCLN